MSEVQRPVARRRFGAVVLAFSVLVHAALLLVVAWRGGAVDAFAFRSVDATEYYALAENLLDGGVFSTSQERPLVPDYWRTPGYPVSLAMMMGVVGKSPAALVVVQQLLSILNVWLVFVIARAQMTDRRALVVGMLYLVAPYRLFYTTWLLATTVFSTSLLLLWWLWLRWRDKQMLPRALAVGVVAGVCVLVRPIAMLIPAALAVGCWLVARRSSGTECASESAPVGTRSTWKPALMMLFACVVVVSAWVVRNRVVGGHWSLSSQGGVVLAYFKATEVELWQQGRSGDRYRETSLDVNRLDEPHLVWDEIDRRLQASFPNLPEDARQTLTWRHVAQGNRSRVDPFAVSSALTHIGWSMLLDRPIATVAFCLGRSVEALVFPLHLAFEKDATTAQRLRYACVGALYALLVALAAFRVLRRRVVWQDAFFPLACTACLLLGTAPQLDPRFRVPMLPFLLVLAFLPRRDGCAGAASEPETSSCARTS